MALTNRSKKILKWALRDMRGVDAELDLILADIAAIKSSFNGSVISTVEVASQFIGQVAGMTTDVTIDADVAGVAGDVTLTADSITDIDGLILAHNTANPGNALTLSAGDGSQIPTADIVLAGGVDEVSFTLTVEADVAGAASNDSITGDGASDCAALIGALTEAYTISAGGASIPANGEIVSISGGADLISSSGSLSDIAKFELKDGLCDITAYNELIAALEAGSGSSALSARTKKIMRWMFCDNSAYNDFLNNM